jgi:hypothetical protein
MVFAKAKMNDWDRTLYVVAERLCMPVYKLRAEMPLAELIGWVDHFRQQSQPANEEPIDLTQITPEQARAMFS